ncbi:MAG: polyprenyl synthetase family protein [Halothiobacillaceae bacterium]
MANFSFTDYWQQARTRFEQTLGDLLDEMLHDAPATLAAAIRYAVLGGGKRLRPLLVDAAARTGRATGREAVDRAGLSVELIHVYSLVHDDLPAMDDDDLRRGRPTLHRAWDEATAILVGDALQPMAFGLLARLPDADPGLQLELVRLLAEGAGPAGMVGGQLLDLTAVGAPADLATLQTMHRAKTGALIRAAVRMGAALGGLGEAERAALDRYADALGLAFQVHDDVLDEIGDEAELGKRTGADRAREKPSFANLLGVQEAADLSGRLAEDARAALDGFDHRADALRAIARFAVERSH